MQINNKTTWSLIQSFCQSRSFSPYELNSRALVASKFYRLKWFCSKPECANHATDFRLFLRVSPSELCFLYDHLASIRLPVNWIYLGKFYSAGGTWLTIGHTEWVMNQSFWGGYVVHHQSSEEYNFSVALASEFRFRWCGLFAFSCHWRSSVLIRFICTRFSLHYVVSVLDSYRFWSIRWAGWIHFQYASHHRVHHGRNPSTLTKKSRGTLIIWDKMFGTFQEEERPTYGITKTYQLAGMRVGQLQSLCRYEPRPEKVTKWSDKQVSFKKPGWLPGTWVAIARHRK